MRENAECGCRLPAIANGPSAGYGNLVDRRVGIAHRVAERLEAFVVGGAHPTFSGSMASSRRRLDDGDFVIGQAVKPVDELVDLAVGGIDLPLELLLFVRVLGCGCTMNSLAIKFQWRLQV